MAQQEKRDVVVTINNGQALSSIKELEGASRKLRSEWRKATNVNDRKKLASELKSVNTELGKLRAETRPAASGLSKLTKSFSALFGVAAGYLGFQVITETFSNLIRRGTQLSDSLADVKKTTGLTDQEVRQLDKDLRKLDTRSTRKELLALAKEGGRLGIKGVADIRKFVEEADKINVALGEDLGDDAVLQIGKIAAAFDTNMTKIGSSINTVGQETKAQEGYLVDFLSRMQGTGVTAKIAAPDIIGYGAAIDSLGLPVEMASTALNKFYIDFVKNTEEFGEVAGFAQGELSKLIGSEGTNAGFIAFLEKLKAANPEADQFLKRLEEIGIDGARGSQVFLALSNNLDMVRDSQKLANDAFDEGTSILEEFNTRNENFAADVIKVQRWMSAQFMNSALMDGVRGFFGTMADYMKVPVSKKMEEENIALNVLIGRITEANVSNDERLTLLKELQKNYPDFLRNLDAETVSNSELVNQLKLVNEQMINRIIIQRKQEELDAQNEKVADARERQMEAEADLRERVAIMAQRYNVTLEEGMTLDEKARKVSQASINEVNKSTALQGRLVNTAANDAHNLRSAYLELTGAEAQLKRATEESNNILQEREELMRALNIGATPQASSGAPTSPGLNLGGGEPSAEEKQAAKKWADETKKLIEELKNAKIEAIEDVEARELAALEAAYNRRVAEIEAMEADEKAKNELIQQLTINHENEKTRIVADAHQERLEEEERLKQEAHDFDLHLLQLRIEATEEGSKEELDALLDMLQKRLMIETEGLIEGSNQKLLIEEKFQQAKNALIKSYEEQQEAATEESLERQKEKFERMASELESVFSELFDTIKQGYDIQIQQAEQSRDRQIELLQQQLDAGIISQKNFEQQKEAIERQYAQRERAAKRKQFEVDKAANIIKATMAMALAINTAMSGGPVLGQVLAGITAVLAGIQIGMIASQPNPYYKGGRTRVTDSEGFTHNAQNVGSFADGGYFSAPSLGIVGERGEELVVPNYILKSPDFADSIRHIEAGIDRTLGPGGSRSGGAQLPKGDSIQKSSTDTMLASVIAENNRLMSHLIENGIRSKAVWEWDDFNSGVLLQEKIDGKHYFSQGEQTRTPGKQV